MASTSQFSPSLVPSEMASGGGKRVNRPVLTKVPLDATVLLDLDQMIAAFAESPMQTFESFRALASSWSVLELFDTKSAGFRAPQVHESAVEYATLLFEAVVRRAVKPDASFDARLGAVYLLLLLHEKQPGRPRRPVPVLSAQWEGFHRLATEMRTQRNADGFAALHALLWEDGGRVEHRYGDRTSVNAADQEVEDAAEREALILPARLGVNTLGYCRYADTLRDDSGNGVLAELAEREGYYAHAYRAANMPEHPTIAGPGASGEKELYKQLKEVLEKYQSGRRGPSRTAAEEAAAEEEEAAGAAADSGGRRSTTKGQRDASRKRAAARAPDREPVGNRKKVGRGKPPAAGSAAHLPKARKGPGGGWGLQ